MSFVSPEHAARAALRDSREDSARMLQTLFGNLDAMAYRCRDDAQWTMEFVSDGCRKLTGYEPADLLFNERISFESLTHPEDRARVRDTVHLALDSRSRYEVEYRLMHADGSIRWVTERGIGLFDEQGRVTALEGIIQDITARKRVEDSSRDAEQRYRALFDNAIEGIFRTSVDGHYLDANPALARMYGFDSPQEMILGLSDIRRQLYVQAGRRQDFIEQIRKHGMVSRFESQIYRRSGEVIWISENARAVFDAAGNVLHYEGMVEDITEQKQYQQSLIEATTAAAAANRAKSEFLANMSHEIRTPMNGIIGMADLMLETTLDRTQRDYAETIRASSGALLTVINDVLDFSKIEAGKLDLEALELNLREAVEDVGSTMAVQAVAKQLELIVIVEPEVPELVIGDGQRLRQCLINLVGNAIKFTPQGEVVLKVGAEGEGDARKIRFEVRDTGIGIAQHALKTLFDPFVQADSSTTRHFGGTGLGLSIVRRVVRMMGGDVGVQSEVGAGSTFWFSVPLKSADASVSPSQILSVTARVLVVDDNATNCAALTARLRAAGYEASGAESAETALVQMHTAVDRGAPFDVVLADLQMPGTDGAVLGKSINADPALRSARVVMLTSLDRYSEMQHFVSMGFAGYLSKPVRSTELFACVNKVMARESREWHLQTQPLVAGRRAGDSDARLFSGRVLVVEDNPVNQKVAQRFLERLGCAVTLAHNGAEGVDLFQRGEFDLVLMDLQMPVMDGLTATRLIRSCETTGLRTPIVALTANAMVGELERCLAVGMDDFLTKPVLIDRLRETLRKYLDSNDEALLDDVAAATIVASSAVETSGAAPIDLGKWAQVTGGDHEFARELTSTFSASAKSVLSEMQSSLSNRSQLQRAAHKLKGASSNVHATCLKQLCMAVEVGAHVLDEARLTEYFDRMTAEIQRAIAVLQRLNNESVITTR